MKKNMEAQEYLTENGKRIFDLIVDKIKDSGLQDVDTFKLSMLADAIDEYHICTKKLKEQENGFVNKHDQISPLVSVRDKALQAVIKLSPAFGIDIASREKISAFSKAEDEQDFEV